jgi:hypothetical protein
MAAAAKCKMSTSMTGIEAVWSARTKARALASLEGGANCEDEGGGLESEELAAVSKPRPWLPPVMIIVFP